MINVLSTPCYSSLYTVNIFHCNLYHWSVSSPAMLLNKLISQFTRLSKTHRAHSHRLKMKTDTCTLFYVVKLCRSALCGDQRPLKKRGVRARNEDYTWYLPKHLECCSHWRRLATYPVQLGGSVRSVVTLVCTRPVSIVYFIFPHIFKQMAYIADAWISLQ